MPEHATKPASKPGDTVTPPPQQTPKPKEDEKVSHALDAFARADATSVQAAASAYKMRTDKVENKQLVGTEERGITASGTHESAVQATVLSMPTTQGAAKAGAVTSPMASRPDRKSKLRRHIPLDRKTACGLMARI